MSSSNHKITFDDEESITEEEQSIRTHRPFETEPQTLEENSNSPSITTIKEAPEWLIFNPHMIHGYRVNHENTTSLIKSMFQLHNETTNIWTHLLGSIIFLWLFFYTFRYFDPLETEYKKFLTHLKSVDWRQFSGALHYNKIIEFVQRVRDKGRFHGVKGYQLYKKIVDSWEANKQYLGNVEGINFKTSIANFMSGFPAIFGRSEGDINKEDLEAFSMLFKAVIL